MKRRIAVVALPHLGAEERLRREGLTGLSRSFALSAPVRGAMRLASVDRSAAAAGLAPGMGVADARAICPELVTRPAEPERLAAFRRALARWAERFSPLVGLAEADALVLDSTGCAHLFGGEAAMLGRIEAGLGDLGLTARAALADTRGAAWALAHYGTQPIAPAGQTRAAIGPLPVAALRIEPETAEALAAVGLGTVDAAARVPRGQLARRFGIECMRRLDQALGAEPEPVSPERPAPAFAARLTLPEPVGLAADVEAGLERLLERLCTALERQQMGARRLRLVARRVDGADQAAEIALARPGRDPMRIRELFRPRIDELDAGYGIDALRLVALAVEPMKPAQGPAGRESDRLADLISRIGNRIGFERVIRPLPAESHIPERSFILASAAWGEPAPWPRPAPHPPRPLTLFRPERLEVRAGADPATNHPPPRFRWRRQDFALAAATGPERIAPEWWWDDPDWRSGTRDYWRAETAEGPRLWLFHTPVADRPAWYAHGEFA